MRTQILNLCLLAALAACGPEPLAESATYGPDPELAAPHQNILPDIHVPEIVGWAAGAGPRAPQGFSVTRFAEGLDHPRWIYVLPNGDVLVAESATKAGRVGDVEDWVTERVLERAGALGASADRITLLRDDDGDGVVDTSGPFLEHLNQPFGMVEHGGYLYVGNTDAVVRYPYQPGATRITAPAETILPLPYHAEDNGHWTRNLVASPDGSKLYVAVGSASNIADYGMEVEQGRAAIHEFNPDGSGARIFASGLRNPNGMDWEPSTGALWTAVNERDMLGPDLVPDYMTRVRDGGFYGWPWLYWGDHPDPRFDADERPVNQALKPDYALGAHTAALGLVFYDGASFPAHYRGGVFIGQHGSWNRSTPSGYQVVFVPFANGEPAGMPEPFLTGFLNAEGAAQGRPVGVALDRTGALLVADDAGDTIWRVAAN